MMVLAFLSTLPPRCQEWLLFRYDPPSELSVESLNSCLGLWWFPTKGSEFAHKDGKGSTAPFLVPEYDDGEVVLGRCDALTFLNFTCAKELAMDSTHASLVYKRDEVEQRFALSRGRDNDLNLTMTVLYSDSSVFIKNIRVNPDKREELVVTSWMCLRGDLSRPEFRVLACVAQLCPHKAKTVVPYDWQRLSANVHDNGDNDPLASPASCDCKTQREALMTRSICDKEPQVHSLFEMYEGQLRRIIYDCSLVKTMKLYSLEEVVCDTKTGPQTMRISVPIRGMCKVTEMRLLSDEPLAERRVNFVQKRLESMINFRGPTLALALTSLRNINALEGSVGLLPPTEPRQPARARPRITVSGVKDDRVCSDLSPESEVSCDTSKASRPNAVASAAAVAAAARSQHQCRLCASSFPRKCELDRHVKCVHLNEKRFSCKQCARSFYQRTHLTAHISEVHEGVRHSACESCGRRFGNSSKLRRHVRMVHLNERPFHCDRCPNAFFQRSDLQRHLHVQHSAPSR